MYAKVFAILCLCAYFGQARSSAIPVWEFLSKQEKTSYLYSLFATEVEEFCKTTPIDNCNHQLLKHGLDTLKELSEQELDVLDPYQRGANNLVWDTLIRGHPVANSPKAAKIPSTTTAKPNSYDDDSFDEFDFGSELSASARIETVYKVPPPKGFIFTAASGKPIYVYPNNVPVEDEDKKPYTKFVDHYTTRYNAPESGPMVVRVHPDGTPVEEDKTPVPYDEDLRQYQLSKVVIPKL